MLLCTPTNLRRELEAGIRLNRKHTDLSEELQLRFTGSDYQEGRESEFEAHENHEHEFVTNTLGHLAMWDPRTKVSSSSPSTHRGLASALKLSMDRWARDTVIGDTLLEVGLDCEFGFGCILITMQPLPGYEDLDAPPLRPLCSRISPRMFFQDPQATARDRPRWLAHAWVRDKDDLINAVDRDGKHIFDVDALEALTSDAGLDEVLDKLPDGVERVERHQIVGYEVWVPEKGMIYTLAWSSVRDEGGQTEKRSRWIRKERKAFCPRWGPYIRFGLMLVPDQVYPLPPLAVCAGLVEELNAHETQIADQADQARTLTFFDSRNTKVRQALKSGKHGTLQGIPGYAKGMVETVQIGGPPRESMDYTDRLRLRLDRKSGITQTMSGNLTGVTLGEVEFAQANADIRIDLMKRMFRAGVKLMFKTVAWYLVHSEFAVFKVGVPGGSPIPGFEDVPEGEMADGLYLGGLEEGEDDPFDALEFDIEAYSLEYVSEQKRRLDMREQLDIALTLAPLMPQMPWMKWGLIIDDVYEAYGRSDPRRWFNLPLLEVMASMAAMGMPISLGEPEPGNQMTAGLFRPPAAPMPGRGAGRPGLTSRGPQNMGAGMGRPGAGRPPGGAGAGAKGPGYARAA